MSDGEDKPALKRGPDGNDGPANKKPYYGDEELSDESLGVKILIPSAAVGAVIGKGGESMRLLKSDNNCRVQMSKNTETYPGTNERICLVKGKLSNVLAVIESIQDKIREKCDQTGSDAFDHKNTSRAHEVKIVMPNTSAGMVIGKSGSNIKEIREAYSCQIQVFPKAGSNEAKNMQERVVTVAHENQASLMTACARVLEKVAADPHHGSEIKDDFGKGPANSSGLSIGQASSQPFNTSFGSNVGSAGYGAANGYGQPQATYAAPYNNGGIQANPQLPKFNPLSNAGNTELLTFLDNLQSTLRTSGFQEQSVAEVMQAMQVLAKYNIMGLGLGLGVAAMAQMRGSQEVQQQQVQQQQTQAVQQAQQQTQSAHGAAAYGYQQMTTATDPQAPYTAAWRR